MSCKDGVYLLTIPGRLPGCNEWIETERTNRHKAAKLKRETQDKIRWYIRRDLKGVKLWKDPVILQYKWYEPNRRRDKDNIAFAHKFIQDALVEEHVLLNDGWEDIDSFWDEFYVDKNKARVEVRIWTKEEGGSIVLA